MAERSRSGSALERPSAIVRPLRAADEPAVLSLLQAAFGRWPRGAGEASAEDFFGWKHRMSPFGPSTLLVAELDGRLAGFLALMPWLLRFGAQVRRTVRGVDLAVDPALQRRGVAMRLIAASREQYAPEVALGWSNPNDLSRGGVLSSGRRQVSVLPRFVGAGAPVRGAVRRLSAHGAAGDHAAGGHAADGAAALLADEELLARALSPPGGGREAIATARDTDFLRWRYGPPGGYRAIAVRGRAGRVGVAIFHVRRRARLSVAQICELLVEQGDAGVARRLVGAVRRASEAHLVTCVVPSSRAAALCALVRVPGRLTVAANPLHGDLRPDPTQPGSWALSLGDLELI
jgi:hypothetical protein